MRSTQIIIALAATLAAAVPTPENSAVTEPQTIDTGNGIITIGHEKRAVDQTIDTGNGLVTVGHSSDETKRSVNLEARMDEKTTSCAPGNTYVNIDDFSDHQNRKMMGFNSAVKEFCNRMATGWNGNPIIVPQNSQSNGISSSVVKYEFEYDTTSRPVGLVGGTRGQIEFEIHNTLDRELTVDYNDCVTFLSNLSKKDGKANKCYKKDSSTENYDATKGGTWQHVVKEGGKDKKITYHAYPATV